jgi:hypothetical protein
MRRTEFRAKPRCCDKDGWDTETEALAALDRKKRITYGPPPPSGVYRCTHGSWHLKTRGEPTVDGLSPWQQTVRAVHERDGHRCMICLRSEGLIDPHHRRLKQSGGSKAPDTDAPQNLVTLCRTCHDGVHADRIRAEETGYIVPSGKNPALIPVAHREYGEIYLTPACTYESVRAIGGAA